MEILSKEETKDLVKSEFKDLSQQNRDLLYELNIWKYAIRGFFILALGGSIFGIIRARDIIDDRIKLQQREFDKLSIASLMAQGGDAKAALIATESFIAPLMSNDKLDLSSLSEAQKPFLFFTLLRILANIHDKDPSNSGEYIGKVQWKTLVNNRSFELYELNYDSRWHFNLEMRIAYLRFSENNQDLE